MRKNKMMRLASCLLVAVLLTTSMISGTFAKYVTTATGEDSARVAKFGVVITANGSTFAEKYNDAADAAGTKVVSSVSGKDVVAPGTYGDMVAMTLEGTPEVAVNVKYEATVELGEGWKAKDNTEYCPIVFTVNGDTYGMTGIKDYAGQAVQHEYATVADLEAAVKGAIDGYTADYAANQDLSAVDTVKTPAVSWAWAFAKNDDAKDTYLGEQAAKDAAATIDLTVKTTVTQID